MAAMAMGFFVMNGLGESLDGRTETVFSKAGSGFIACSLAGLAIYRAQKKAG